MTENTTKQFEGVTVVCKANVFFDGRVVSHTVLFGNGSKKTLGLIYPGQFTFNTAAAEVMEIIAGTCRSRLKGEEAWTTYAAGMSFRVPANSAFDIAVEEGTAEYVCSFE